jgi:hypothetical protein
MLHDQPLGGRVNLAGVFRIATFCDGLLCRDVPHVAVGQPDDERPAKRTVRLDGLADLRIQLTWKRQQGAVVERQAGLFYGEVARPGLAQFLVESCLVVVTHAVGLHRDLAIRLGQDFFRPTPLFFA